MYCTEISDSIFERVGTLKSKGRIAQTSVPRKEDLINLYMLEQRSEEEILLVEVEEEGILVYYSPVNAKWMYHSDVVQPNAPEDFNMFEGTTWAKTFNEAFKGMSNKDILLVMWSSMEEHRDERGSMFTEILKFIAKGEKV